MGFSSKARVTKSRSIARVVAPPTPIIVSPTGANLVTQGGQVIAGGASASPTGAQLVAQGGTPVYGGINARPTGASLVAQGGTPGVFAPLHLTSLVGFWDATAITGKNDGDSVDAWTDGSGNGWTLSQATGVNRPLYKTAIQNGKPILRFDGSNDFLATSSLGLAQPTTICVVANVAGATTDVFIDGNTSHENALYLDATGKFNIYAGTVRTGPSNRGGAFHVFTGVFNGASSRGYVDGAQEIATNNAGAQVLDLTLVVGAGPGGINPASCDIGVVILCNADLSDAERLIMERALGVLWGITVA